jgi:hypothetical protein
MIVGSSWCWLHVREGKSRLGDAIDGLLKMAQLSPHSRIRNCCSWGRICFLLPSIERKPCRFLGCKSCLRRNGQMSFCSQRVGGTHVATRQDLYQSFSSLCYQVWAFSGLQKEACFLRRKINGIVKVTPHWWTSSTSKEIGNVWRDATHNQYWKRKLQAWGGKYPRA